MNSIREYMTVLRRRWAIVFWTCTVVLTLAVIAAYGTEAIYRSSGTIMIEKPEISPELVQSTVVGVIEQQIQLLRRRVLQSENLEPLIEEYDLYPNLDASERAGQLRVDTLIEQVDPITLEPKLDASAFTIHYYYPDPVIARDVARELVDLFVADNRATRTESAANTEQFFEAEAAKLADDLAVAGDRLAEFKLRSQGLLPGDIESNRQTLERLREDQLSVQASTRLATERRNLLAVQLQELAGGTELAKLRAELAVAKQKYSDDHPDIRRLTRAIAALESAEGATDAMPSDIQRVSAQLEAVEREIAAYATREQELRQRITDLEGRLVSAPEVEKELLQLTQEYALANEDYQLIRQKHSEARIGSNLEIQDKSERYTVIREPSVPFSPDFPNRLGVLLIGILIAVGGSAVLVALREGGDRSVRGSRDVAEILGSPPLANIPIVRNSDDRKRVWQRLVVHGVAFMLVITLATGILING